MWGEGVGASVEAGEAAERSEASAELGRLQHFPYFFAVVQNGVLCCRV